MFKKADRRKLEKTCQTMRLKDEGYLKLLLVPLIAQLTLTINKKLYFEKLDFQHIFDDPSFLRVGGKGGWVCKFRK